MKCYELITCNTGGVHHCGNEAKNFVPVYTLDGDKIGGSYVCPRHAILLGGRDQIMQGMRELLAREAKKQGERRKRSNHPIRYNRGE